MAKMLLGEWDIIGYGDNFFLPHRPSIGLYLVFRQIKLNDLLKKSRVSSVGNLHHVTLAFKP